MIADVEVSIALRNLYISKSVFYQIRSLVVILLNQVSEYWFGAPMLGVFIFVLFVIITLVFSVILLAGLKWREEDGKGRVAVVVLGDIGRSPRMQYHALSLCREGYDVELVGYGGTI